MTGKEFLHYIILSGIIIYYYHVQDIHLVHATKGLMLGLLFTIILSDKVLHKYLLNEK